jgi:general stress protein YciG
MENPIHIERDEERERPDQLREEPAPEGAEGGERRAETAAAAPEGRPVERPQGPSRKGLRGTAAMDPDTRQEVARKGGLAVSRNRQHMAEIGRKGGQTVSKNRDHMASIGRKGGEASRGQR